MSAWYGPGVTPVPGDRYEFEDFVGARFTATLATFSTVPMDDADGSPCVGLHLTFDDREPFETNLPVRFRDVGSRMSADEPYWISDERDAEIRALLDEDHPARGVDTYQLAAAVYDLLAERDDLGALRKLSDSLP